jgi:LmbE family N-acetylglucosaminyl deacetylase
MGTLGRKLRGRLWRALARLQNRGFRSSLRLDPAAPAVLLSPHLDDAVINCWSALRAPGDLRVVNICGGPPESGFVSYWDRLCRARESAALFRERIVEDAEALGLAGRQPMNLPFLEAQYREADPLPLFSQIDEALTARVPAVSGLYAPAGIGVVHPDHQLTRDYALVLASAGFPLRLYADLPYCGVYGWPAWVTGEPEDPYLDVDAYWRGSLPAGATFGTREGAEVVRLEAPEASAKLQAMRAYRTQFPTLNRGPIGLLANPLMHRFEVFWAVR